MYEIGHQHLKLVINIPMLSLTHFVSNIRHQHRCSLLNHLNWNSSEQRWCFDPSFCWNMERLYSCILINLRLVPFEYFQNMDKPFRISKIEFMAGTWSRDISANLTPTMWWKQWVIAMNQIKWKVPWIVVNVIGWPFVDLV